MEDIIAYGLVVGVIVLVAVAIAKLVRAYRNHMTLEAEHKAEVEQWLKNERAKMSYKNKPAFKVAGNTPRREEVKKKVETPTTTTTDNSDDGFLTGMLMGTVLNTVLHNSESSSSSSKSSSSDSSWGLDDSDSRSSISSSMSDSWSSSDSGPSSDW